MITIAIYAALLFAFGFLLFILNRKRRAHVDRPDSTVFQVTAPLVIATPLVLWLVLELALATLLYSKAHAQFGSNFKMQPPSALMMWAGTSEGACLRGPHAWLLSSGKTHHWSFRKMSWQSSKL